MPRRILYPFASNGDYREIPDADTTSSGAVNYQTGYGIDYQKRLDVESGAKNIDRSGFNGVLYDATDNIKTWQDQTYPDWYNPTGSPTDQGYKKKSVVRYTDGNVYVSKINNNRDLPTNSMSWEYQYTTEEFLSAIPEIYRGAASSGGNFRTPPYSNTNGVWDFPTDALVSGFGFPPPGAIAGSLFVKVSGSVCTQVYVDNSGSTYVQGSDLSFGSWAPWKKTASTDMVFRNDLSQIPTGNNSIDWNSLTTAGAVSVFSMAGPNAPPSDPISTQGSLLVSSGAGGIVSQTFVYRRTVAPVSTTIYTRVYTPESAVWSPWTIGANNKVNLAGDTMSGALALFSGSTVPTAAQFDSTTKVVNSAFVQGEKGNKSGFTTLSVNTSLTLAHVGSLVAIGSPNITLTLPPASSVRQGSTIYVIALNKGVINASTNIVLWDLSSPNVAMAYGETCEFTSNGTNWYASGGSLVVRPIGTHQTWQNVAASRNVNVSYVNNTGRPIMVIAGLITDSEKGTAMLVVDGVQISGSSSYNAGAPQSFATAIIPAGSTYTLGTTAGTPQLTSWVELR